MDDKTATTHQESKFVPSLYEDPMCDIADDLSERYDATPRQTLASLRDVDSKEHQFSSANEHARRATDHRLESYTYSSMEDLTAAAADPEGALMVQRCVRLIVAGVTGAGKSATGNTLLQAPVFRTSPSATAQTTETEMRSAEVGGRMLEVVDTPGSWKLPKDVFNTNDNELYVFVINLASPRFEEKQLQKVRQMKDGRGRLILKNHMGLVLLTHAAEALKDVNLTEYIHGVRGQPLEQLITQDLQGWRVLAVNNLPQTQYEKRQQEEQLTRTIDAVNRAAVRGASKVTVSRTKRVVAILVGLIVIAAIVLFVYYVIF